MNPLWNHWYSKSLAMLRLEHSGTSTNLGSVYKICLSWTTGRLDRAKENTVDGLKKYTRLLKILFEVTWVLDKVEENWRRIDEDLKTFFGRPTPRSKKTGEDWWETVELTKTDEKLFGETDSAMRNCWTNDEDWRKTEGFARKHLLLCTYLPWRKSGFFRLIPPLKVPCGSLVLARGKPSFLTSSSMYQEKRKHIFNFVPSLGFPYVHLCNLATKNTYKVISGYRFILSTMAELANTRSIPTNIIHKIVYSLKFKNFLISNRAGIITYFI